MAGQWIIMVPANQLGPDDLWHVKQTLLVQHFFDLFPAFFQALFSDLLSLLILQLQLW